MALYDDLYARTPSPVVGIGRALAIAEVRGLDAGRDALVALANEAKLAEYPFYWAARAEIELRAGGVPSARELYARARSLARSDAERVAYDRKLRVLRN